MDPQSLLKPIDFEFRRKVVQNDHCYTNLMFDSDKKELVVSTSSSSKSHSSQLSKSATAKNQHNIREKGKTQSDSEESDNEDEKQDEEQSEDEVTFSESDDEDDMDFNVNDRFGRQKGKRKRKYRKHKQKQSTFKDFLETGEISMPDDEHKRKYGKKQKKQSIISPKMVGNTKLLSQETSTFKTNNRPIKKAPVQSSSKDLSTLSFSVLEKSELDANFGMPKVKTENVEKLQAISPTSKNSQSQAQEKEKERIVESIAKDLETSFPEPIINKSKGKTLAPEKISEPSPSVDLTHLKEIDSTDEEIGDAIFAVLGENVLDELLNQTELINFDATQAQSSQQTNENNSPVVVSGANSFDPRTDARELGIPSTAITNTAAKEPTIKVVRNGRVIVLPPIEKPATRGSKRKSTSDFSHTQETITPSSPAMTISTIPAIGIPAKDIKTEKSPIKDTSDSKNSSRRSSLNRSESGRSRNSFNVAAEDETDDLVSDASHASEDDPERLWCICKQPHNNRFMICCDKCEEWFHGKCVNVSKAMGKVIEQGKREWNCPKCKNGTSVPGDKKLNQSKLTKFFSNRNKQQAMCIVCKKKPSNEGSSFCSDECMQNHSNQHCDVSKADTPAKDKNINVSENDITSLYTI